VGAEGGDRPRHVEGRGDEQPAALAGEGGGGLARIFVGGARALLVEEASGRKAEVGHQSPRHLPLGHPLVADGGGEAGDDDGKIRMAPAQGGGSGEPLGRIAEDVGVARRGELSIAGGAAEHHRTGELGRHVGNGREAVFERAHQPLGHGRQRQDHEDDRRGSERRGGEASPSESTEHEARGDEQRDQVDRLDQKADELGERVHAPASPG
jgi:hypothetical protein